MFKNKLLGVGLVCGVFGLVPFGWAQAPSTASDQGTMPQSARPNTFFDDLDELGHNLFGGILSGDDSTPQRSAAPSTGRRGSISQRPTGGDTPPNAAMAPGTRADDGTAAAQSSNANTKGYLLPRGSQYSGVARSTDRLTVGSSAGTSRPGAVAADASPSGRDGGNAGGNLPAPATDRNAAAPNVPGLRPLHERLSGFRHSAFGDEEQAPAATSAQAGSAVASGTPVSSQPKAASPSENAAAESASTAVDRASAPDRRNAVVRQGSLTTAAQGDGASAGVPTRATRKGVAAATPAAAASVPAAVTAPTASTTPRFGVTPPPATASASSENAAARAAVTPEVARAGIAAPTAGRKDNLLVARKSPILGVQTIGPPRIMVGKESTFEIVATNAGDVAAEDVVVFVNLPASAEVADAEPSAGAAQPAASEAGRSLQWRIGQLAANGKARLVLRIVPRENRPIDLAVRWECRPSVSEAKIEVQEAKLAMRLEGPREVFYGKKELFTLRLANTGNGDAENVVITLLPMGTGENRAATHRIGLIAAGEEKPIDIELTPRQSGNLQIKVEARGECDAHAELVETVMVRRASLRMDIEGPQVQFVGAVVAYRIRVKNLGNAPARNIRLSASIPEGAKYLSGISGGRPDANGTTVQWVLDTLNPAMEQIYVMKCSLGMPGVNKVEVVSLAEDDLNAAAAVATRVEAMADLALDVKDPAGPIPIGEEAIYELRVRNRGTKTAEGVEVLAFFSRGIEPVATEGGASKLGPGQVTFEPIPTIAAGATVTLKVHARAEAAGNHIFRAEVHCKPLEVRLVSEQTTHYYVDHAEPAGELHASPEEMVPPPVARTADRRDAAMVPPQGQGTSVIPRK